MTNTIILTLGTAKMVTLVFRNPQVNDIANAMLQRCFVILSLKGLRQIICSQDSPFPEALRHLKPCPHFCFEICSATNSNSDSGREGGESNLLYQRMSRGMHRTRPRPGPRGEGRG